MSEKLMRPAALVMMALALCGGCDKADPRISPRSVATTSPASVHQPPPVPGVDGSAAATDDLLTNPVTRERPKDGYQWDERAAKGSLRVICRIPDSAAVTLPPDKPIDFTGATAIKNPATVEPYRVIYNGISGLGYDIKNEVEYYQKWNAPRVDTPSRWLTRARRGSDRDLLVNGVAIVVEGIKSGSREGLVRGRALVNHRHGRRNFIMGRNNFSGFNVVFVPTNEKIVFGSGDHFPCEISIRNIATGRALGEPFEVKALPFKRDGMYAGWMLRANPGSATQPRPIPAPSPTFREPGVYKMTCLRHPWHVGYAVVVENPYVAVSGARLPDFPSRDGRITISGVPPGTWKVRVWHPLVKPKKAVHEVMIHRDETTHLVVDFLLPDELGKQETKQDERRRPRRR